MWPQCHRCLQRKCCQPWQWYSSVHHAIEVVNWKFLLNKRISSNFSKHKHTQHPAHSGSLLCCLQVCIVHMFSPWSFLFFSLFCCYKLNWECHQAVQEEAPQTILGDGRKPCYSFDWHLLGWEKYRQWRIIRQKEVCLINGHQIQAHCNWNKNKTK